MLFISRVVEEPLVATRPRIGRHTGRRSTCELLIVSSLGIEHTFVLFALHKRMLEVVNRNVLKPRGGGGLPSARQSMHGPLYSPQST